jgi:uncharacterized protein (DUF952 family)
LFEVPLSKLGPMQSKFIYHLCSRENWDTAVEHGVYQCGALDQRDGFIHFSAPDQVRATAARYLAGIPGLVLIKVDSHILGDAVKWEKSRDNLLFPHLYGHLETANVEAAVDVPLDDDGKHIFPDLD